MKERWRSSKVCDGKFRNQSRTEQGNKSNEEYFGFQDLNHKFWEVLNREVEKSGKRTV